MIEILRKRRRLWLGRPIGRCRSAPGLGLAALVAVHFGVALADAQTPAWRGPPTPAPPRLFVAEASPAPVQRLPAPYDPQVRLAGAVLQNDGEEDASVSDRVKELEDAVKELKEAQDAPPDFPTLEIGGRIHFDSWWFAEDDPGIGFFEHPDTGVDPENRIFFRRIRLELEGDIWKNMGWRIQVDFNTPAEAEYKDVYIAFTDLPLLHTVRFGNHKRPLGLDHLNSSRFNVFIERPLVVEAFNEDARRIGASSQGGSEDQLYNWQFGAYLLENTATTGEYVGDSLQASLHGRFWTSPWYDETSGGRGYFHWAIAGMGADPDGDVDPDDANANEGRFRTRSEVRSDERWLNTGRIPGASAYEILAVETIFNAGPLQIVGEYQNNWTQRSDNPPGGGPDLFFHGGYVYVAYMLTGEHVPYDRESGTIGRVKPFENFFVVERCRGGIGSGLGAWQVALRYSHLDLSDSDIRGGVEDNLTLGLVWYFNAYANLQFNAVYGSIDEHEPAGGFTEGDFLALGTRLRMEF
ncbi:MAG: ATPase [Planctomycetes bacterium]|nr:ATPase [Planctomycetota bacterium]